MTYAMFFMIISAIVITPKLNERIAIAISWTYFCAALTSQYLGK